MTTATHTLIVGPQVHPQLGAVFASLDGRGIAWALLRGADELADPQGDVDLIVDRRRWGDVVEALGRLGFTRLPAWGYGSHRFFLNYDRASDTWIKLDVVTDLAFGPGFTLPSNAEGACLERRRRADGVWQLAAADAFWCLLLHKLLDKGSIPADVRGELRTNAGGRTPGRGSDPLESPLAGFVDDLRAPGLDAADLVAFVREGRWSTLNGLAPTMHAAWRRRHRRSVWRRRAAHAFWMTAGKFLRRLRRQGITVALLGPDGAGKSTAAAALESSFFFPARTIYMSPARQGKPHRPGRTPPPGVGFVLGVARQQRRWLRAREQTVKGKLVLFDRYSFDAMLPPRRRLSRLSRMRRWVLARSVPRPHLTIILDAPGDLLYARKGEQTPAILETERRAYLALADRMPASAVVDATQAPDEVRKAITNAVWHRWAARWA